MHHQLPPTKVTGQPVGRLTTGACIVSMAEGGRMTYGACVVNHLKIGGRWCWGLVWPPPLRAARMRID